MIKVTDFGGEVLWDSQGEPSDWGQAVYIRDPNGQLIEIATMEWRSKIPPPPR